MGAAVPCWSPDRLLIGSGAMGTWLRDIGAATSAEPVELLNLRTPEAVRQVHEAYRAAGSDILITNTFAANPLLLEELGLAERTEEINRRGVEIAREAAAGICRVWASVGPLNLGLRLEDFTDGLLTELYARQVAGLAGADAIVLETFVHPREAAAALRAARALGLPVILQMGRVAAGPGARARVREFAQLAEQYHAAALGINCVHPAEAVRMIGWVLAETSRPITAAPNAGQPQIERGRVRYECLPVDFRSWAVELARMGVAVIGGCCGTTPEHIRAIADVLKGRPVAPRVGVPVTRLEPVPPAPPAGPPPNPVRDLMRGPGSLVSVEIRAERTREPAELAAAARRYVEAGADLLDVPDNPGAHVGRDAIITAGRLQSELDVPAIPHLSATQSNLLRLHSTLLGAGDLGLRALLAVTGDAPTMGPLSGLAHRVTDVRSSVELLRLVRELRQGRLLSGERVAAPPDLCAGCAFGQPTPAQVRWLRAKIEAGAEFVFTQPIFDLDGFERLRDALADVGIRVFYGLLPLVSARAAASLAGGRIPGISVPASLVEALQRRSPPEEQWRFGLEQCAALLRTLLAEGHSVYLIPPFGPRGVDATVELLRLHRRAPG